MPQHRCHGRPADAPPPPPGPWADCMASPGQAASRPPPPPRRGPRPVGAGVRNACQQPRRRDKHGTWRGSLGRARDGGQPSLCTGFSGLLFLTPALYPWGRSLGTPYPPGISRKSLLQVYADPARSVRLRTPTPLLGRLVTGWGVGALKRTREVPHFSRLIPHKVGIIILVL